MSADNQLLPTTAPKWQRIPADVRRALDGAIFEQIATYGKPQHRLLREDPRFSRWVGMHTGHRGDKRLDRYIRKLREAQPKKMARLRGARGEPTDKATHPPHETPCDHPQADRDPAALTIIAAGSTTLSHEELHRSLRQTIGRLERAIASGVNEDGESKDPALLATLTQRHLSALSMSVTLTEKLNDALVNPVVHKRLLEAVFEALPSDPQLRAQVGDRMNAVLREFSGMNATRLMP